MCFFTDRALERAFELMDHNRGQAMDLPDASLIAAAEHGQTRRKFTLDRRDFAVYRIRCGDRLVSPEVVPA